MNGLRFVVVGLLAFATTSHAQGQEQWYVGASSVNLRAKPDTNAPIVATLPIATALTVHQGRFALVYPRETCPEEPPIPAAISWPEVSVSEGKYKGKRGYVAADFLVQDRPTVQSLLKRFDQAPSWNHGCRRTWIERALALDPASPEAKKRLALLPSIATLQLQEAISENQLDRVKELIRAGAVVDADITGNPGLEEDRGITPLLGALFKGHTEIAAYLIEQGSNVNAVAALGMGEDTYTPLSIAITKGYDEIVRLLLSKKADPNYCVHSAGGANGTPLVLAVQQNNFGIVRLLLAAGAHPNAEGCQYGGYGVTAACAATGNVAMLRLILSAGGDPNARGQDGSTALMCAAQRGNVDSVDLLLKQGADPNVSDVMGTTALMRSLYLRREEVDLTASGPLVDYEHAFYTHMGAVAKLLILHGANPDIQNKRGESFSGKLKEERYQELATIIYPPKEQYVLSAPERFGFEPHIRRAFGAHVEGNHLFLAESGGSTGFLEIIDISDLRKHVPLSKVLHRRGAFNVTVAKNIAYVVGVEPGLQIIDVSNRANPSSLGSVSFPETASSVKVVDKFAYVLGGWSRNRAWIRIIDISNPTKPRVVGEFLSKEDGATRFHIYENHLFLAHWRAGLYVIDVTRPESPVLRSTFEFGSPVTDVFVTDHTAYVALNRRRDVRVLDVSNVDAPKLVDGLNYSQKIIPYRNSALVRDYQLVVDTSNIAKPKILAALSNYPYVESNYVGHNHLLVGLRDYEILRFPHPVVRPVTPPTK